MVALQAVGLAVPVPLRAGASRAASLVPGPVESGSRAQGLEDLPALGLVQCRQAGKPFLKAGPNA